MSSLLGSLADAVSGREFFDLCKAIGESKSKQEEDRIIAEEIMYLKRVLPISNQSAKKLKELVIRSLYVEMLGQDASFAYMRIVELCASSNVSYKRAGYLAASLTLSPEHEFRFMLVNRMQQDMKSSNMIESCTALSGVCRLVTEDMVPAVMGDVLKLLNHEMDPVRRKAVSALHRLYQLDKSSVSDHYDKIRRIICDKDPAVMGASLGLLLDLAKDDVSIWKDLVPSLVSILKQVIEHRLSKDFDYHRIPAPWLQMNLLRLLAVLGRGDQAASEEIYEVLAEVMKRADTGINVGYAIVYEAIITITNIYPNTVLLDAAATSISRFIRSESHNLKYIGVKGLAAIVKDHPRYAADHQMAVVDCLEDPDETLKRKTLSLLYRMTNSVNVEFIVNKLLHSLETVTDEHFRTDLVGQITQCAERYAPTNAWFVRTMIRVFELAGDRVNSQMAQTLIQLIAEGTDEDEGDGDDATNDDDLRAEAVGDFLALIKQPRLPDLLAQTMCWVLGEYGYLSRNASMDVIVGNLCDLMVSHTSHDDATRGCVVTAIMKLVAQMGTCPAKALLTIQTYETSLSTDVRQRCGEFLKLLKQPGVMVEVLPTDASCEDIEVDENLPFLNNVVNSALSSGAKPYAVPAHLVPEDAIGLKVGLKITPYEMPTAPVNLSALSVLIGTGAGTSAGSGATDVSGSPHTTTSASPAFSSASKVGGPWSRTMEAPKLNKVVTSPMQQAEQDRQQRKEEEELRQKEYEAQQLRNSNSPSNVQSSIAAPAPVPAKPREPTEKEKMAAALFSGFDGSSASSSGNGASSRRPRASDKSPAVIAVAPVVPISSASTSDDLLGVGGDEVVLDGNSSAPSSGGGGGVGGGGLFDDMDDLTLLSGPSSAPPPVPPPPIESGDDDLLFGGMSFNSTEPAAAGTGATPLRLTTPEFGAKWGSNPAEAKRNIPIGACGAENLSQLQSALEGTGCYAHVESIGQTNEAIYAASSSTGTVMLVHIKLLDMQGAVVTVRSTIADSSNKEADFLTSLLMA